MVIVQEQTRANWELWERNSKSMIPLPEPVDSSMIQYTSNCCNYHYQKQGLTLPQILNLRLALIMINMPGLTLGQLADLYDASPPEVRKWMHENIHLVTGKEKPY